MKINKTSNLILLIALLTNLQYARAEHNGSYLYMSPGLQFSYNKSDGYSVSAQVTIGAIIDEHKQYPFPGISVGSRKYFKSGVKYSYADCQLSFGYGGVGIGKIFKSEQQSASIELKYGAVC